MTTDDPPPTTPICSVCGDPAGIRHTDANDATLWYCAIHFPAPASLDENQKREWAARMPFFVFLHQNRRMPSLDHPDERELILRLIPDAAPGTARFRENHAELERQARLLIWHHQSMDGIRSACNLLFLPISLPLMVVNGIASQLTRRRKSHFPTKKDAIEKGQSR